MRKDDFISRIQSEDSNASFDNKEEECNNIKKHRFKDLIKGKSKEEKDDEESSASKSDTEQNQHDIFIENDSDTPDVTDDPFFSVYK